MTDMQSSHGSQKAIVAKCQQGRKDVFKELTISYTLSRMRWQLEGN